MLKLNEKSTEKPRKKLSFREPEVEANVSPSSKNFYLGLHPACSDFANNYYDDSCVYNHRPSAVKQLAQPPSAKIGSPRRQSLIQLQPISTVLKSRINAHNESRGVGEEAEEEGGEMLSRILNDSNCFEKQLRLLLEKELALNVRQSPGVDAEEPAGCSASSAARTEGNVLRAQQPAIVIDDVDGNERTDDSIDDDGLTNGSLDDVYLESQAMRIVRTVGQAFEVCHKLSLHHSQQTVDGQEDAISERSSDVIINAEKNRKLKFPADGASEPNSCDTQTEEIPLQDPALLQQQQLIPDTSVGSVSASTSVSTPTTVSTAGNLQRPNRLEPIPPPPDSDSNRGALLTEGETYSSPMSKPLPAFDSLPNAGTPLSTHHQVQLLREQLDQQQQQTQVAIAQVHLLRDQLAAETAARLEVQARIHQLLVHNRELLDHIHRLVLQMQELEAKTQGLENKSSPQRFQQQMQEYNYLSQIPITTPSSAPTSFPDYQSLMDPNQAINSITSDQSSLYENHNPSISGLEPPTSPLQMCNSPVPSYGSGGVTPLHYSGSLNRSPSLRIQQQQQQQSHTPPINANEQLRQVLSNNNNFYQQQRTGNYYRSPPNTAPSVMLRQMQQQTTPSEELDQRYKMALAQDSGGNRMDLAYLDNYSLPMPKLNPPPQRKRPTSRQSSLVNQQISGQSEDTLTPTDVNICNSNEDLLVKQRLQLANSFLMSEQVNKLLDSDKSASDVTQQTLIDLGNMNLNERNKQQQQQFFQSNGPGSYVTNPPRSAPSTLTTYMDDTNLERLGRMQRMTWTRHTVGK